MQDKRLDCLEAKVDAILTNHLPHIQKGIDDVAVKVEIASTDLRWIKKFFWIVTSASVGSLVVGILRFIIK